MEGWVVDSRIWQGVAMDSLKFQPDPPCLALQRPAGGPPLKRSYGLGTPHAIRLRWKERMEGWVVPWNWWDCAAMRLCGDCAACVRRGVRRGEVPICFIISSFITLWIAMKRERENHIGIVAIMTSVISHHQGRRRRGVRGVSRPCLFLWLYTLQAANS
jgi:hypothetical protein